MLKKIASRLLLTESEWNPKVMLGRAVVFVLPAPAVHAIKKVYYAHLLKRFSEDWHERDVLVVKEIVAPGDHVVDIGACIGTYTKYLSERVGPLGRVYSFEPIPPTFDFLSNNVRKLGLRNVTLFDCAVSDMESSATMVIPTYRWGAESWYDARFDDELADPSWRRIQIKTRTLDSLLDKPGVRISFMKCDAESHELECLRGALRTLRTSRPAMLIEIDSNADQLGTGAFETFAFLRNEGYRAYWFDGKSLRIRHQGERSQNYFFLTADHIAALRKRHTLPLSLD